MADRGAFGLREVEFDLGECDPFDGKRWKGVLNFRAIAAIEQEIALPTLARQFDHLTVPLTTIARVVFEMVKSGHPERCPFTFEEIGEGVASASQIEVMKQIKVALQAALAGPAQAEENADTGKVTPPKS